MDVKTLSMIIGHISVETTLDIYSHVTSTMKKQAAMLIDRKFTDADAQVFQEQQKHVLPGNFMPYRPKYRKPGTGCISQINDHLWEGRYSPTVDGRRISKNVYAKTESECEDRLMALIEEVKSGAVCKSDG